MMMESVKAKVWTVLSSANQEREWENAYCILNTSVWSPPLCEKQVGHLRKGKCDKKLEK